MIRLFSILFALCLSASAANRTFLWDAVSGAVSYKLMRGATASTVTNLHATATTNSITVTNVPLGQYWKIVSVNELGMESPASAAITLNIGRVRAGQVRATRIIVR